MPLHRRTLLSLSAVLPIGVSGGIAQALAAPLDPAGWTAFRTRFVSNGRVVDDGNGDVSHSEGQGYGLILAAAFDDRDGFDSIRGWTRTHLQIRPGDHLHAWRFEPGHAEAVPDHNNATDGDLLIAYGLARGGHRWNRPDLVAAAEAIFQDVARLLVRNVGGRLMLLPGMDGFERADGMVVNPSYLVFPALSLAGDMAAPDDRTQWRRLRTDGLALLRDSRFGRWNLPPDWLIVSPHSGPQLAHDWPPRFSFDAVRVPLYLFWDGLLDDGERTRFRTYWNSFGPADLPAWVDLRTNATAPYPASPGVRAIASCTGLALPPGSLPDALRAASQPDYYSAALSLLSQLAWSERQSA